MTTLVLAQAANAASNDAYFLYGCLLFAAALALLVLELFVPSGGLIGILAGIAAIGSTVAFFMYDTSWGIGVGVAYIVMTPILLVFMFKLWLNSPLGSAMILGGQADAADESEESNRRSEVARRQRLAELEALVGAEGVTETALRPVGMVRLGDHRIDAMSETGIIEANTPVVVTTVYDNQIKVRPRG
ncbi:MAG: hypothetical protein HKO59_04740 [Phycisphaerales bacterium]|nr:hypothetical protein [Phycisphaerae bacterium]NNF44071.1 hypothetical protein [Phycisphaerales bacterium]NNM25284.1 hypothetical protein [Phycisphaerales bacterium]